MTDWLSPYTRRVNAAVLLAGPARIAASSKVHRLVDEWFESWYKVEVERRGMYMTPIHKQRLKWAVKPRLGIPGPEAYDLAVGMSKDVTDVVLAHISSRLDNGANIFAHFTGETGSGKSSCSLWLGAESGVYDQPIKSAGDLEARLCFESWEVPDVLKAVEARGCGWKDESPREAGVGSRTALNNVLNLEDTIRASQKSLHMASPELPERTTTQISFTAIAQTSLKTFGLDGNGQTMFIVERGKQPLGFALIPWCKPDIWNAYQAVKKEYVARALSAGKDGSGRLGGYLQLLAEQRPALFQQLRGQRITDYNDLVGLAMGNFNLDDATVKQVAKVTFRAMNWIEDSGLLPEEALVDFTAATGVQIPTAMCQALEGVFMGQEAVVAA